MFLEALDIKVVYGILSSFELEAVSLYSFILAMKESE